MLVPRLIVTVALASVLSACTANVFTFADNIFAESTPTVDEARIAHGVDVYLESYCGVCHVLDAANTRGTFGPAHNNMGTIAAERIISPTYSGNATTPADYLRESLLEPQAYIADGYAASSHAMPPFTHLSDEDIDALVYLLLHQYE